MTIKDKVDGLLKINIRPNLDVILQIYAKEDTEESEKEFKIYLQTLQLVLKEARWAKSMISNSFLFFVFLVKTIYRIL